MSVINSERKHRLDFVLHEAIKLRIESFETRNAQSDMFVESNDLSIESLQHKIAGKTTKSNEVHQLAINKKEEAKKLSAKCDALIEQSQMLEHAYHRILEYFSEKV